MARVSLAESELAERESANSSVFRRAEFYGSAGIEESRLHIYRGGALKRRITTASLARGIKGTWTNASHPVWTFIQQITLRGAIALKYYILARLLGAEAVGLVGVALIALSAAESITDTGLVPAIVQHRGNLTREQANAVWSVLVLRGIVIGSILGLASPLIAAFLGAPTASGLLAWAAGIPVSRNAVSLGVYYAQRARNFKRLAFLQAVVSLLDVVATFSFVFMGFGAIAAIWSSLLAESVRVLLSYRLFPVYTRLSFSWRPIADLLQYGRWVWGSSGLAFLLNQLDKVIIARYLGAAELGLYQISYKFAQLGISDAAQALSLYLFPTFADKNRRSHAGAKKYFRRTLAAVAGGAIIVAGLMILEAKNLFLMLFGDKWILAVPLFRVLVLTMVFGALIAVIVVYLRAIGKPQLVTFTVGVQLFIQLLFGVLLVVHYGALGMAWALVASTAVSFLLLLYFAERN